MARKKRGPAAIKPVKSKLTAGDRGYKRWRTLFGKRTCRKLKATTFGGGVTIASISRLAEDRYPALAAISATISASCVPFYSVIKNGDLQLEIRELVDKIKNLIVEIVKLRDLCSLQELELLSFDLDPQLTVDEKITWCNNWLNSAIGFLAIVFVAADNYNSEFPSWISFATNSLVVASHITSAHFLREKLEELNKKHEDLNNIVLDLSKCIFATRQEQIKNLTTQISAALETMRGLEQDLEEKRLQIGECQQELNKVQTKISQLETTLETKSEYLETTRVQLSSKDKWIVQLEKEQLGTKVELVKTSRQCREKQMQIDKLEQEIIAARARLIEISKQHQEQQSQIDTLEQANVELQRQLETGEEADEESRSVHSPGLSHQSRL
jgi:hypothetical protein